MNERLFCVALLIRELLACWLRCRTSVLCGYVSRHFKAAPKLLLRWRVSAVVPSSEANRQTDDVFAGKRNDTNTLSTPGPGKCSCTTLCTALCHEEILQSGSNTTSAKSHGCYLPQVAYQNVNACVFYNIHRVQHPWSLYVIHITIDIMRVLEGHTFISTDVKTIYISVDIVMNIVTNCLVIVLISRYAELRKDLSALFMLLLSVSDLGIGCIVMPISAAVCSNVTPNVKYMVGVLPGVHMFCIWWFSFNSFHSLCRLTVCKMIAVTRPFQFEQIVTLNRCRFIIVFNWILCAALAATKLTIDAEFARKVCAYRFPPGSDVSPLILVTYTVGTVIPLSGLVYSTTRIFIIVMRAHSTNPVQVHAIDASSTGNAATVVMRSIRSAANILIICFVSLALTVPMILFLALRHTGLGEMMTSDVKLSTIWLFSCNTFMNSLLYVVLHRSMRKKTRLLFSELYQLVRCTSG